MKADIRIGKTPRVIVLELRVVVDGDNAKELFENLAETTRSIEDTLTQYGGLEHFKIYERRGGNTSATTGKGARG